MAKNIIKVTIESNKPAYKKALDEVAEAVLTRWGMQTESSAKDLCPVDTGLLHNSITWALAGQGTNITEYSDDDGNQNGFYSGQAPADWGKSPRHVHVGSNVEYAAYQELGTVNMTANPYLRPAVEENKDWYQRVLDGELKKALTN